MNAPTVIGLDLSLTGTGVASPSGNDTIRTGDKRGLARLAYIRGLINDHLSMYTPISLAVIEGPAYSRATGAGHHEAAGLWWMVAADLATAGIDIRVCPPSVLKKYATGKGNATKADMRMALYQRTGLDLRDDNQVDAWFLRAIGLDYLGHALITLPVAQHVTAEKLTRLEA